MAAKTVIKIEIVILAVLLLAAAGLWLVAEGVFSDPVIAERAPVPVPTEMAEAPTLPQEPHLTQAAAGSQPDQETREITAPRYFAYDIRSDTYLVKQGDGAEKLYPASITKLLTAYVATQYLQPEDTVQVDEALELVQADSSVAGLKAGDRLTTSQLISAMLLPSGNDAAQTVAVAAGRVIAGDGSLPYEQAAAVFVEEMNRQAQALGMVNSHFENADGYHHDDHYTTMDDLVVLCRKILTEPVILACTSQARETVTLPDRTLDWRNSNLLLDSGSGVYQPNVIGLKTGYTGMAGSCLISAFFMEDRVWLIGVFGCPAETQDRYLDTLAIYNSLL